MKITIETKIGPFYSDTKTFTAETTYEDVDIEEITYTLLNLLQSAGYERQNIIETFKDY
jgi:hypothetical protein